MLAPEEVAQQLVPYLEARGLSVCLGKAIQSGFTLNLSEGTVSGQVVVYVDKKGARRLVAQKPIVDHPQIVELVNAAWAASQSGHLAKAPAPEPRRDYGLRTFLVALSEVVDVCETAQLQVDWAYLSDELAWIAASMDLELQTKGIANSDEWRRAAGILAKQLA